MKFFAFFTLVACVAGLAWEADTKERQGKGEFKEKAIGDKWFFYKTAMTPQSYADAKDSCVNEGACLADFTGFTPLMFGQLARFLPEDTKFWIGGSAGPLSETDYLTPCSGVPVDFGTIEPGKIDLTSSSCLAFNRPIDSLASKIVTFPCDTATDVVALCSTL